MAITQISKIQVRTGNYSDLPVLSSGEFGWATDQKRLFIGNPGSTCPAQNSELLTTGSPITSVGSDQEVIFNCSGTLDGSANFTYNYLAGVVYLNGDLTLNNLNANNGTIALANTTATTVNAFGAATTLNLGANTGTLTVGNPTVVGTQATQNLYNTVATTVNFAGAATDIQIGSATGTTNVNNNLDVDGDLNIDGGDLTVSTSTFNLANTTATTINFGGAACTLSIGHANSTATFNNCVIITGDLTVNGTCTIINTCVLDVEDKNIVMGNVATPTDSTADGGGIILKGTTDKTILWYDATDRWTSNQNFEAPTFVGDLATTNATANLYNTTATTINFGGAATDIQIGSATGTTNVNNNLDVDGDVNIDGGDLTVSTSTFNLANTTATTGNLFGAATTVSIGAAGGSGVMTLKNDNVVIDGDLEIKGGDLSTNQTTFNLLNTNANCINFGGAATDIQIGSATGTTNINNNLDVDGDLNIDGGDLTVSTSTFNLANTTATTINFAGAACTLSIGHCCSTATFGKDVVVTGSLTVCGATTSICSCLTVSDNNLILNAVTSPTDAGADLGGICLNGTTTKSILWYCATNNWCSNQNFSAPVFCSTVADGTAPLCVSSCTKVTNLNADYLDGYSTDSANTASSVVIRDASGNFSACCITATSFCGTATQVSNSLCNGSYITGSNYNGSAGVTFAVDATDANTANKVVARDANGDFSARYITATSFCGTATQVSNSLCNGSYITGNNYNGSAGVTFAVDATSTCCASKVVARDANGDFGARCISGTCFTGTATQVSNSLCNGSYITGSNYNGSSGITFAVDATTTCCANKVVARDANGDFGAGTITASLSGNATTATCLATSRDINSVSFNGSSNISFYDSFATGTTSPAPCSFPQNSIRGFDAYQSTDFPGNYYTGLTMSGPGCVRSAQIAFNWDSEEAQPTAAYFRTNDDTCTTTAWSAWTKFWTNADSTITMTGITTGCSSTAGSITGTWTLTSGSSLNATYADLAEYYTADQKYTTGTVLAFGGEKELTLPDNQNYKKIAGVVSTNPAYTMNNAIKDEGVAIALAGRTPVKVYGTICKGDLLVASKCCPGTATVGEDGGLIGRALQNYNSNEVGEIEVMVNRF